MKCMLLCVSSLCAVSHGTSSHALLSPPRQKVSRSCHSCTNGLKWRETHSNTFISIVFSYWRPWTNPEQTYAPMQCLFDSLIDQVTWYCLQFSLTLLPRFEFTPGTEMTKFAVHTTLAALVMPKPCTGLASVWVPQNRMQTLQSWPYQVHIFPYLYPFYLFYPSFVSQVRLGEAKSLGCRSDATVTRWTVPRTSGTWAVRPGNKSRDNLNIPGHLVVPSRLSSPWSEIAASSVIRW